MYASGGNHVMAESGFQFNLISNVLRGAIFHGIRHGEGADRYAWLVEITDPLQTYVVLEKNGNILYRYGNESYKSDMKLLLDKERQKRMEGKEEDRNYSCTEGGEYRLLDRKVIRNETYRLFVIARQPVDRNDDAIERAFHWILRFIVLILALFILLTSYLLSRFVISGIISPLKELKKGAESIREGDLSVHLRHGREDEFSPAIDAFNMMAWQLKRLLREKEREEERKNELIASISHDLRTPLTSIKAYVDGLLDHVASTPAMEERYFRVIQKKSDVLEHLIEELLLLPKMDIGEKALPMESMNLGETVRQFIEENKLGWSQKGADFSIHREEDVIVKASPLLLERIVDNLISNSIRYKKEESVSIEIRIFKEGRAAYLMVVDNGPGVPQEALGRLKEAFYRTDKARSRTDKGSGLGLSIVDKAAGLMKGRVDFKNRKPHGLEVIVTLPLEETNDETHTDCGR